jgi:hypothetical protein
MFYWLNNFVQCLPPFFHQGVGLNPTSCTTFNIPHLIHRFLIFYTELILKKYKDFFLKR